jgi:hypothetical protein
VICIGRIRTIIRNKGGEDGRIGPQDEVFCHW